MSGLPVEERIARLEIMTGEAQAHGMIALIAFGELLPEIARDQPDPAAFVEQMRERVRKRIEPFYAQPQSQAVGARILALVDQVFAHAAQAFRRKN